ncbi:hypothetical protein TCAL_07404 [Tigriopus californicus]|uniref:adenylate cyclase n=1 Tax=Tigriopus californicus TaxID=6832 RepID=A0A553P8T1_TIGCA|nr:hypothetical protein TCAL_07404 [Tigriopus californicus]
MHQVQFQTQPPNFRPSNNNPSDDLRSINPKACLEAIELIPATPQETFDQSEDNPNMANLTKHGKGDDNGSETVPFTPNASKLPQIVKSPLNSPKDQSGLGAIPGGPMQQQQQQQKQQQQKHRQAKRTSTVSHYYRSTSCWPLLFERASPNWWHPQFDSRILEDQYWTSTLPRTTRRFQFGLTYLLVLSLLMAVYFPCMRTKHWPTFLGLSLATCCLVVFVLFLSTSPMFAKHTFKISIALSFLVCAISILATTNVKSSNSPENDISPAGLYALYLAIMLLLYTAVPLPLYGIVLIGVTYSVLFETFLCYKLPERTASDATLVVNILLHICIHVIGTHSLITNQVRMRDTFMKVGQSLMVKKQLVTEKGLKEKMIHSVMPPQVADWLMREGHTEDVDDLEDDLDISESGSMVRKISSPRSSNQGDIRTIFRPFNMNAMENVSILFADIVGFTKMSSNKTASQLVGLLNDLFGRFDFLCNKCGCEKISTLGDCYYCVSGCPEPKPNHALNCVEMGLAMISAIKDFDEDCHESVNMRVGIHTGTVLCGIVGKRRFKFDVWSNDVSLANKMESTGKPGMVHISEKTYEFLKEEYFVQEGEPVKDMKTYFITGRASPNFVPLDTRMARRTSSTPATFLLPAITQTDATGNVVTQSMPSLPGHGPGSANSNRSGRGLASIPSLSGTGQPSVNSGHAPISVSVDNAAAIVTYVSYSPIGITKTTAVTTTMANQHFVKNNNSGSNDIPGNGTEASTPGAQANSEGSFAENGQYLNRRISPLTISLTEQLQPSPLSSSPPQSAGLLSFTSPLLSEGWPSSSTPKSAGWQPEEPPQFPHPLALQTRRRSLSVPAMALRSSSVLASATDGRELLSSAGLSIHGSSSDNEGHSGLGREGGSKLHSAQSMASLRHQSDQAMMLCVREDGGHHSYFSRPPLKSFSLCFEDPHMERDYRRTAWKPNRFIRDGEHRTLASATFNAFFDILVSGVLLLTVAIACFLHYPFNVIWLLYFIASALYHLAVVVMCFKHLWHTSKRRTTLSRIYSWCRGWYASHVFGLILLALPILSVFANFNCSFLDGKGERELYLQLFFFGVIHFSNLTALNNWVKSSLASLLALLFILLSSPLVCPCENPGNRAASVNLENSTTSFVVTDGFQLIKCDHLHSTLFMETIVCLIYLIALVWLLNREFEISYRLSFHCSLLSAKDRKAIQNLKNQADWLLHNIIPKYVSDQLKKTMQEYSENHLDIGVIFASLVNFNELYDESYMGGKEYLRVLNELISDFDEILDRHEFRNVEKIKTIGSTFMAASGVNPYIRKENTHNYQHLHELMEFVLELQNSVNEFNQSLIEFDLILRIGFNFGDITAGVIGTTKLYYDIWGDAVNIASRMESTGVEGRIQVSEKSMEILKEWYDFEKRGSIFVKGKDNMTTYLLIGRKPN